MFRHLQFTQAHPPFPALFSVFFGPVIYCNSLIDVYLSFVAVSLPECEFEEQLGMTASQAPALARKLHLSTCLLWCFFHFTSHNLHNPRWVREGRGKLWKKRILSVRILKQVGVCLASMKKEQRKSEWQVQKVLQLLLLDLSLNYQPNPEHFSSCISSVSL